MARVTILKKDGTPSQYFWSDSEKAKGNQKTVFKQIEGRVKRMIGVHYNAATHRIEKQ